MQSWFLWNTVARMGFTALLRAKKGAVSDLRLPGTGGRAGPQTTAMCKVISVEHGDQIGRYGAVPRKEESSVRLSCAREWAELNGPTSTYSRLIVLGGAAQDCSKEMAPLASKEVYLGSCFGWLILVPGIPWLDLRMGGWRLPSKELQACPGTIFVTWLLRRGTCARCARLCRASIVCSSPWLACFCINLLNAVECTRH